jgi:hypothetical protein
LGDFGPTLNLISWADLEPEELQWLPDGYVPVGALAVFAGDGGVGKTRLAMSQAAAVTRRQRWPLHAPPCKDGEEVAEGPTRVLFCGAEDAVRGFLLPAFLAAGGDKTRVASIESLFVPTRDGKGQREVGFDLSERALAALAGALATREYAEVILDGLTGYVEGDGKGDTVTRRSLTPFVRLLRQHDVAGVGLMHFNKGAKRAADKLIESVAFRNVPRTVYYVVPDPDPAEAGREDYRRLVFNHKINGGRFRDPFAYRVRDAPVPDSAVRTGAVAWDAGEIAVGLDDALAAADANPDRPEDRARARDCVRSLKELLAEGGLPGDEVAAWRRSLGFSERALDDAKQELGVKPRKVGFGGGGRWVLWLPGTPLQAPAPDAEAKSAKEAHSPPKSPNSGGAGGPPDFGAGRTNGQDRYLQAQREFLAAARKEEGR